MLKKKLQKMRMDLNAALDVCYTKGSGPILQIKPELVLGMHHLVRSVQHVTLLYKTFDSATIPKEIFE